MNKFLAMAVAASALAVAAPASAQQWQSINERQDRLDERIDVGVRHGALTRNEAVRLRAEFNDLARLEARYRSSYGLSNAERRDLDARFDALSARIRYERQDGDDRGDRWDGDDRDGRWNGDDRDGRWNGDDRDGRWNDDRGRRWQPINQRQNMLENRINAGIRSGRLNRNEAYGLRMEFREIAQLESRYRRNGLSYQERRDLDRRFDRLSAHLEASLNDRDRRRG